MKGLVRSSQLFIKRNGSTILTVVGGVGVVTTTVLGIKATPKALALIENAKKQKGEKLTKLEKIQAAAPVYIPTVVSGAATLACIFGANILNKRQQVGLASAYALLDSSYKEYKNKVQELYGEEAHNAVQEEVAKEKYEKIKPEFDELLVYDEFSGNYFSTTYIKLARAEYELNRNICMRGWADLNEFYEILGVDGIDGGDELGWSEGGNLARYWQGWVDFSHRTATMEDGTDYMILTIYQEPYICFEDDC